jgi:hypothetical protein
MTDEARQRVERWFPIQVAGRKYDGAPHPLRVPWAIAELAYAYNAARREQWWQRRDKAIATKRRTYAANRAELLENAKARQSDPRWIARRLLRSAVECRRVLKPVVCEDCGLATQARALHGHHEDYSKPLVVVWVCRKCHGKRHRLEAESAALVARLAEALAGKANA